MKVLLALTAIALLAALAPAAHATIQIQFQIDALPIVTCSAPLSGPVNCSDVFVPPISIVGEGADSNSPGSLTLSVLTNAMVDIANLTSAPVTLQVGVSANDFVMPTTPPNLLFLSHIGGTVVTGGASNSLSFQSCLDPSNALDGLPSSGVACVPGAFGAGVSTPSITSVGVFDDFENATLGSIAAPYSLNEALVVTLAPGGEIIFSASSQIGSLPEPTSILLLGTSVLGFSALARKRLFRK